MSLREIVECFGGRFYSSIPDFTECQCETDILDRGLGIYCVPSVPHSVKVEGVERQVTKEGVKTTVQIHTPAGSIQVTSSFTEEMPAAGASVSWVTEHAIRRRGGRYRESLWALDASVPLLWTRAVSGHDPR
jgi:hypothetical protein